MNIYKNEEIKLLTSNELSLYADVIRKSFATVAQDFGWTRENAPGHVSFKTDEQLASNTTEGYYPFGLFIGDKIIGFVSLTDMGGGRFEMNKLSVLPEHRHYGYGKKLLDFCKEKVREFGGNKITLDLVEENTALKNWYIENGFTHTGTKKFDFLPFTTGYMEWSEKMGKPHGIIIFGANGSGKTTLACELARILNFKHMDIEDYAFAQSGIPYTAERSREEQTKLMLADIKKHGSFVISAVTGDFGDEISSMYDLAIFLEAPREMRLERVKQRAYEQHSDRVRDGGDMFESHLKFIDFVAARSMTPIEAWAKTLACPVVRIDGTGDYKQSAADIANRFYTKPGEPWRVNITPIGELSPYRFVVVFARYQGKWLYCRAKTRDTWETAGGHIEKAANGGLGETPYEAAKRELYEETGAVPIELFGVFDYSMHNENHFSSGRVFLAEIDSLGEIPDYEMAEVRLFDTIPDKMRFPQILPLLFKKLQHHMTTQSCPNELWDIYDENRNPTGRTHRRGDPMKNGDYHLVVYIWLQNSSGEFLITRRSPEKHYPLLWECTGGSAVAGDDSLTAAIREVKEETGLDALPENGKILFNKKSDKAFCDIWLFRQDFDLTDVVLQEGETVDAKWASPDEIRKMTIAGDFAVFDYLEKLFDETDM